MDGGNESQDYLSVLANAAAADVAATAASDVAAAAAAAVVQLRQGQGEQRRQQLEEENLTEEDRELRLRFPLMRQQRDELQVRATELARQLMQEQQRRQELQQRNTVLAQQVIQARLHRQQEPMEEDNHVPVVDNYRLVGYLQPGEITSVDADICCMCDTKKACTVWEKNGDTPNFHYLCFDCPQEREEFKTMENSPWPMKEDMPLHLIGDHFTTALQAAIWEECTTRIFDLVDLPSPICNPYNVDTDYSPDFGIQFQSLSRNASIAEDDTVSSNTDSQIGRGSRNGLMKIMAINGPYTAIKMIVIRLIKKYGKQLTREVNLSNGKKRVLHCVMLNSFKETKSKLEESYGSYFPPIWDKDKGVLTIDTEMKNNPVTYLIRLCYLNHWFQALEVYCKLNGTMKGGPEFSHFQIDHLCHNPYCKNFSHIAFTYMGRANNTRHGCRGPPNCPHGMHGVACIIPGHASTGINKGDIPNWTQIIQYVKEQQTRVTLKMCGLNVIHGITLTNNNYSIACVRPLKPLTGGDGEPIMTKPKRNCYVCCLLSERACSYYRGLNRTIIKSGQPGRITARRLFVCETCEIEVCPQHLRHEDMIHFDEDHHQRELEQYKKRCAPGNFNEIRRFISEILEDD